MSQTSKTLILSGALLVVVCSVAVAVLNAGASRGKLRTLETSSTPLQLPTQSRGEGKPRNLSLQPEAMKMSRRLGARFGPKSRGTTIATANLKIGTNLQPATIIRRQTDDGESVELVLGNRRLTWTETEGLRIAASSPTASELLLAEQLIFDSPDQFVLAQLRGASYFTVARNVRPVDAGEDYQGPLWTMIRVDEPQQTENARSLSPWRIYYLNTRTGLPDRIEYRLDGQQIRAEFVSWADQNGEKTPAHVTWSNNGQVVMEYRIASISHNN